MLDSKQRDSLLESTVNLRESGKLEDALRGFTDILHVDELNKNFKGYIDVLGHKKITLTHLANMSKSKDEKKDFVKRALEIAGTAISSAEKHFPNDKALRATLDLHLSDALISYHEFAENKVEVLNNAVNLVTSSIENIAGSKAHRAWALNKKAQAQYLLKDVKGAFASLKEAEYAIFEGYEEEIKQADGKMKIKIWLTGIWLTYAHICSKENKIEISNIYANNVINIKDPEKTLTIRKQQAERIIRGNEKTSLESDE